MPNTLIDALLAKAVGDRRFARLPDRTDINYAQFAEGCRHHAAAFAELGLEPGDRVAAQAPKSITFLQAYIGTIMAGGVFVPLSTAYTDAETTALLANARPRILIRQSRRGQIGCTAQEVTLEEDESGSLPLLARRQRGAFAVQPRDPDAIAVILYTSGTTGAPKGAAMSHRALLSNALALRERWGFTDQDRLIHALPLHHTHGLFVATHVALLAGCSMVFFPHFDAEQIVSAMPQATAIMGVPTHYSRILASPRLERRQCTNLRVAICGSAPLPEAVRKAWFGRTGHPLIERYGMTETGIMTAMSPGEVSQDGHVGTALPGVELRLCNDSGVIEMRGSGLFSGYWCNPPATAAAYTPDGYFNTQDIARHTDDGAIRIEGRLRDLVISGGLNIHPREVEDVIDQMNGVAESAAFGVPHPDFGEALMAAVVRDHTHTVDEASIRRHLAVHLARFKHPKHLTFPPSLPRNAMGKIVKSALRDQFMHHFDSAQDNR